MKTQENIIRSVVTGELDDLIRQVSDVVKNDKNLIQYVEKEMSTIFARKNKMSSRKGRGNRFFTGNTISFLDGTLFVRITPSGKKGYCYSQLGVETPFSPFTFPLKICLRHTASEAWKEITLQEALQLIEEKSAL